MSILDWGYLGLVGAIILALAIRDALRRELRRDYRGRGYDDRDRRDYYR